MWDAFAKFAGLASLLIQRLWPAKSSPAEPTADPRDIATGQSSGYAADRSGKATSQRERQSRGD